MLAERFDSRPVNELLKRHARHTLPYTVEFANEQFVILPDVFNPAYTKVSGFLARNIVVSPGDAVLEMFSGSGAVGLSVARCASRLVGIDISPAAVQCAQENATRLGFLDKVDFRHGDLWRALQPSEKFDIIIANPPLLPAIPETVLEMAVADGPEMDLTRRFIAGLPGHLNRGGHALMAFSNACSVYVGDPLQFIDKESKIANVTWSVQSIWDVGYETYRIIRFST